jgi:hypothetical protein
MFLSLKAAKARPSPTAVAVFARRAHHRRHRSRLDTCCAKVTSRRTGMNSATARKKTPPQRR